MLYKFIIHFSFYICSAGMTHSWHTCIFINDEIVKMYYEDVGYIEWNIKQKDILSISENSVNATFHLEYKDMKCILKLHNSTAIYIIMVDEYVDEVQLIRNKTKHKRHKRISNR